MEGEIRPAQDAREWSTQTYGSHFVEVGVDPVTGEVRVRRMLGVFAAGRIINAKTARPADRRDDLGRRLGADRDQSGGRRYGSLLNQDLAQYLVPVQADIGEVEAIMLDEVDDKANPMGIKGVGELGNFGARGRGGQRRLQRLRRARARLPDHPTSFGGLIAQGGEGGDHCLPISQNTSAQTVLFLAEA